jgi:glycosyltransferase involved in cell wall biosynthesis
MIAATRPLRALLRRARAGYRLFIHAREIGWRGAAVRAARRLTGAAAPRSESADSETGRPRAGAAFDVIYAVGYWPGEPKRYRVFNVAEALRAAGYGVYVMPFERLDDIRHYRWTARVLVLFRAEYDRLVGIDEVLAYARQTGMRVVYDVDDLVFDAAVAEGIDAVRRMPRHQRREYIRATERRRKLLLVADLVTVSTGYLARRVEQLGRPSVVIPNSINTEQQRVAAQMMAAPRRRDGLRIAYLSGSATHQRDFAECEPALLAVMDRHEGVRFRLVGYLDLGPRWQRYGSRVERIGLLSPADMLRCLGEVDINLAPLELGNPFCEGKSELKFFEAALVGVPTVASATETFAAAIEDGATGFVVRSDDEWERALELLISDAGRRCAIGEGARARALARYGLAAIAKRAVAALGLETPPVEAAGAARPIASGSFPSP